MPVLPSNERVTQALEAAEITDGGETLRALAAHVLTRLDGMATSDLESENVELLGVDLATESDLGTAAMLQVISETPELHEGARTCPPAVLALESVYGARVVAGELLGVMAWSMLCSLVEWLIRDELERRGVAVVLA